MIFLIILSSISPNVRFMLHRQCSAYQKWPMWRCDSMTPPCPPTGTMIRRKKSVLFNIIPSTTFKLLGSSFATFSKASRNLSKAHSVAVTISTSHHFRGAVCVRTTFYLFQKFFGRRLLLPLALYPFLLLFLSIPWKFHRFRSCKREIHPHSLCKLVFSQHSPQSATMSLLFHDCRPLPRSSTATPGPVPSIFRCNTTDTNCPCRTPSYHRRSKLPESEGFVTAAIVAPKHRPSWSADRLPPGSGSMILSHTLPQNTYAELIPAKKNCSCITK